MLLAASSARRTTLTAVLPPKRSISRVRRLVQILVVLVGDDPVEVAGDGAHVAVDGPLVVVEHHDQALGLLGDVVQRLKGDAVGEGARRRPRRSRAPLPPARSRATAMPSAAESAVPACPAP